MPEIPESHVSTTTSLEGWDIEAYLGPIVTSVVAGAGFITEFFAGFTDVFGGQSKSIAARLTDLYGAASLELRRKAAARGANWVVGYRVDFDEVSGKGTFMFMLTASGTGIRAVRRRVEDGGIAESDTVTGSHVSTTIKRLELAARDYSAFDGDSAWEFSIENQVTEVAPQVIKWMGRNYRDSAANAFSSQDTKQLLTKPLAYFASLPPQTAASVLYEALLTADRHEARGITDVILQLSLLDLVAVSKTLVKGSPLARVMALRTLECQQPYYTSAALSLLDQLTKNIPSAFPVYVTVKDSRGLLGKKQVWTCLCGVDNDEPGSERCDTCSRDKRGFLPKDLTPPKAIERITAVRTALASMIEQRD